MLLKNIVSKQSASNQSLDLKYSPAASYNEISTRNNFDESQLRNFINHLYQSNPQDFRTNSRNDFQQKHSKVQIKAAAKINKQQQEPQMIEQMGLIENYRGSHNNFKTYFKSKKFKKIYNQLLKQMPLQKSYYTIYMQDKLFSLNKHIKQSLVHKETSFTEYLSPYFDSGKKFIGQFYQYFLIDDQLHKGTKKVNLQAVSCKPNEKSCSTNQFFYIIITYLYQTAIFYRSKNLRKEAKIYYQANLKIVHKILGSSTSNSRLRRKICQYLISFASFLIQSRELIKAKKILQIALQNCINLIGIIEFKLRYSFQVKNRTNSSDHLFEKYKKKTNLKLKEAFKFMIAIYLNSSVIFELQHKEHLSYLALNQVKNIEQILYKNFSVKSKISEALKKPKESFDCYNEKLYVIKSYFDFRKIREGLKEQEEMKYNENIAIYGLSKTDKITEQKNKQVLQLFFNENGKIDPIKKPRPSIFTSKIDLIEYDSQIDPQERQRDKQNKNKASKYIINTKNANGIQSTSVYNNNRFSNQKRASTIDFSGGQRRQGKKLSKFCNENTSEKKVNFRENKKSITIFQTNSNKEIQKLEKKLSYHSLKSSKQSNDTQRKQRNQNEKKQTDFLDGLIDSQIHNRNYFLYGKQFVDKFDLLSKGKTLYDRNQNRIISSDSSTKKKKKIQYSRKDEIAAISSTDNFKKMNATNFLKKKGGRVENYKFQQSKKKSSIHIVKANNDSLLDSKQNKFQRDQIKKGATKSLKNSPMKYNEVMQRIEKTQQQFMRKDCIDKNSIYRLKCRSQNTVKSASIINYISGDSLAKTATNGAIMNSMEKENVKQAIIVKFQQGEKLYQTINNQAKLNNLSKKTLNPNLNFHNQTGIRLFKKIIFKHKKSLKITKSDLFVNYNKNQSRDQQIKLVEKQSFLMVQYKMCEQQTKARIKQNMQQLIMENIRKSEQHEERVEKLNMAINEFGKSRKSNERSVRLKDEYESSKNSNLPISSNPNYLNFNFQNHKKDKKTSSTEQLVHNIFQQRILLGSNQKDAFVFDTENFLTGNKNSNTNLFLTSIKYKQQRGNKRIKTVKNLSKMWKKPESEEDESQFQENLQQNVNELRNSNKSVDKKYGRHQEDLNVLSNNWI